MTQHMLQVRQLQCLNCPFVREIDFNNKAHIILLVGWLEDLKIRELSINERDGIKTDGDNWERSFSDYLCKLGCPLLQITSNTLHERICWLIAHAIAVEFEDCSTSTSINDLIEIALEYTNTSNNDSYSNDVNMTNDDTIDTRAVLEDGIITDEIDSLGQLVKIQRSNSEKDVDYLKRLANYIKLHLSTGSIECMDVANTIDTTFVDFKLGFDTNDAIVNKVAVILKLLHCSDLRELQNDINAILVLGQEYTANPKTNTSLGKVGR